MFENILKLPTTTTLLYSKQQICHGYNAFINKENVNKDLIFHVNCLRANNSHDIVRLVCYQD